MCACTNLTRKTVNVFIEFRSGETVYVDDVKTILSGSVGHSYLLYTNTLANCNVRFEDESVTLNKHLACTVSAMDGDGNTTVVKSVNKKFLRKLTQNENESDGFILHGNWIMTNANEPIMEGTEP